MINGIVTSSTNIKPGHVFIWPAKQLQPNQDEGGVEEEENERGEGAGEGVEEEGDASVVNEDDAETEDVEQEEEEIHRSSDEDYVEASKKRPRTQAAGNTRFTLHSLQKLNDNQYHS